MLGSPIQPLNNWDQTVIRETIFLASEMVFVEDPGKDLDKVVCRIFPKILQDLQLENPRIICVSCKDLHWSFTILWQILKKLSSKVFEVSLQILLRSSKVFEDSLQISQRFYMVPWNSWHVFQGSLNIQHTVPVQGFSSLNLVAVQCQPLVINLFKSFPPLLPLYILVFLLSVWTILTSSVSLIFQLGAADKDSGLQIA